MKSKKKNPKQAIIEKVYGYKETKDIEQADYVAQFESIRHKIIGKTYGYRTVYCSECGMEAQKVEQSVLYCQYCGEQLRD